VIFACFESQRSPASAYLALPADEAMLAVRFIPSCFGDHALYDHGLTLLPVLDRRGYWPDPRPLPAQSLRRRRQQTHVLLEVLVTVLGR